jgi:glycosyltransferase involved in cell wall biosynthesis
MLKILYIITQSELGGAQKNVLDLATGLKNRHQVLVAAGNEGSGRFFEVLRKSQIPCVRLKYLRRSINPYFDLLGLLEIRKLVKKERPDVLHLHSSKAGLLGSLAGETLRFSSALFGINRSGYRLKIIYTVHGAVFTAAFSTLTQKIFLWLEKSAAYLKDKIICVSANDKKLWLENRAAPENKLTVIHNGIASEKIEFLEENKARKELIEFLDVRHPEIQMLQYSGCLTSRKTKIVGTIANFYPEKGLLYLIKAAKFMGKNALAPEAIFVIIGEGPDRKMLEGMIKERGLENKFFLTGALPNAAQYLKAFDVFVLPSIKEGFPYVLLEAMAARLPIIASLVGGTPEIIDNGKNGFLILSKNPKILAERITDILDNPELAGKLSQGAGEKVKEFSVEKMIEETERVYLEK